ncbi:hypothetical protein SteCoe_21448 [Stentor coeruleus]|uniref:Uncharacterized protein n=1 Tax=Stentor coeruleus TaxID=5963 RepID=A0A1R2BPF1_9CILI|nr:hypothetical protein SteCoe_21448 [Stentor coeruleus]
MCNLNIKCQVSDGSCRCCRKPEVQATPNPLSVPFMTSTDPSVLFTLFRIITQQNEMIRKIAEQTSLSIEKITRIEQSLEASQSITTYNNEDSTTSSKLMNILCGANPIHTHRLSLLSDVPNPAYKERAFSLLLQIVDENGNKVVLTENIKFSLMLFSTESPSKVMKVNTAGDQIMRGTIEVEANSTVFFRKIVLKEVSSHFRNGHFFLVVAPKGCSYIKPLIVENFVVKARKMGAGKAEKKAKVDDKPVQV